ncbi:MAG: GC-type dockerin domain-anchored protein [Phycisphaerales bacterium JB052]
MGEVTAHGGDTLLVTGNRLYAVSGTGLNIYDVDEPRSPEMLGSLEFMFGLSDGVLVGDWVVALTRRELVAINISDPAQPFIDGSVDFDDDVLQIEVLGDHAYVSSEDETEIHVVDISNMFFPMLAGTIELEDFCTDMEARHGLLSVYDSGFGLRVFDLVDGAMPTEVGAIGQPGVNATIAWHGDRLYMMGSLGGLQVVDLDDPTAPVIEQWLYPDYGIGGLFEVGDRVFAPVGGVVRELDLQTGAGFASVISSRYGISSIEHAGETMYIGGNNGIQLVDIPSLPRSPIVYEDAYRVISPGNVVADDGFVYVSDMREGFAVWDMREPETPELVSTIDTLSLDAVLTKKGDAMYVLQRHQSPALFDVSDPASPVEVGSLGLESVMGVEYLGVFGDLLFASEYDGARLYDVSDPFAPVLLSELETTMYPQWAAREGDWLYVIGGVNGIDVFDISDPAQPVFVLNHPVPSLLESVHVEGGILFTEDYPSHPLSVVRAFDFNNLADVQQVGMFEPPIWDRVDQVRLVDGVLYLVNGSSTFMLDVSDPSAMREIGILQGSGIYAVEDDLLFGFDGFNMRVLDVSTRCGACPGDLNDDGVLNFFDVSAFLVAYQAQGPVADWNGDGDWDFFDVSGFLQDYLVGCP